MANLRRKGSKLILGWGAAGINRAVDGFTAIQQK